MNGKIQSSRTRKTIAIMAGLLVLVAGAVTGVTTFLKDDDTAQATTIANQTVIGQNQSSNSQSSETVVEAKDQIQEQEVVQDTALTVSEGNEETALANASQTQTGVTGVADGTTNGTDTATQTTSTATQAVTGTSQTATDTTNANNAAQPSEYITYREVTEPEHLNLGWTSTTMPKIMESITGKNIYKSDLEYEKNSYTESDMIQEDGSLKRPEESKYNITSAGELILYEIKVKNNGNLDKNNLVIYDNVPEGTQCIQIGENGKEENGKITWKVDLPKDEEIALRFLVQVNDTAEGTIANTAVVDNKNTNATKNVIITENKAFEISRNGTKVTEVANVGDEILYTITVKNTGEIDGVVNIKDVIPENTKLVSDILLDGKKIDEATMNSGTDVTIEAGKEAILTFSVIIEKADGEIVNVSKVGRKTTKTVTKVANLELSKTVSTSKNGEYGEDVTLKANETACFKIEMKNTGSVDLNLNLKDIMNGKELDLYDGEEKVTATTSLAAGTTKVLTATYTMLQEDIDNDKILKNEITASDENIVATSDSASIIPFDELSHIDIQKTTDSVISVETEIEKEITADTRVRPGDIITYTITVKNDGKKALHDIEVTDTLDIEYNGKIIKANEPIDVIDCLRINEEKTYTVHYTVTQDDIDNEAAIKNTAKASNSKIIAEGKADKEVLVNPDVSFTITKIWEDDNNKVNARPKEIILEVQAATQKVMDVTLKPSEEEENSWTSEISGLKKYDENGNEIEYIVVENEVPEHYTKEEDGLTVTNTIDYSTFIKDITVTKEWEDNSNKLELRPEVIKITVNSNSEVQEDINLTLSGDTDTWTKTIEAVRKYDDTGEEIVYTAIEDEENVPEHYTKEEDGLTVTNKIDYSTFLTKVTVTKEWKDDDNKLEARPEVVELVLTSNSEVQENVTVTLSGETDIWTETIEGVREYDDNGEKIVYTATEDEDKIPKHYTKEEDGLTVTNTIKYSTFLTDVTVTKKWEDDNNKVEARPKTAKITLISSLGEENNVNITLSGETNIWTETIEDVREYDDNGDKVEYTAIENDEDVPKHYTRTQKGLIVTNTIKYSTFLTKVTVTKEWDDEDNKVEKRPETVVIRLESNSEAQKDINTTLTGTTNIWTETIEDVREYDDYGEKIKYSAKEDIVPLYYGKTEQGLKVINKIIYGSIKENVTVEKYWNDKGNAAKVRPTTVEFTINSDSELQDPVTINVTGDSENPYWTATTEELLRVYDDDGEKIRYTAEENTELPYYTKRGEGLLVTNSIDFTKILADITVTKKWEDDNNAFGTRPTKLTVVLKSNSNVQQNAGFNMTGSSEEDTWTYVVKNRRVYDKSGNKIKHYVEETVPNYYTSKLSDDGLTITNTYDYENYGKNVTAKVIWQDTDNQDGIRPTSLTVNLKVGDSVKKTATLSEENGWEYTFTKLPKYAANSASISYTIAQDDAIEGYATTVTGDMTTGFTITNIHKEQ